VQGYAIILSRNIHVHVFVHANQNVNVNNNEQKYEIPTQAYLFSLVLYIYWSTERSTYDMQVNGKRFPRIKARAVWNATVSAESAYSRYNGTPDIFAAAQSIVKAND